MIYLNNELLTTERIIRYIEVNKGILKQPKIEAVPSGLVQFQNRLRVLFFKKEDTNEAICARITGDQRFSSYTKLKKVLQIILSLKDPSDIEGAIAQINSLQMNDWEFNPGKFNEYNSCYGYFPEKPELQHLFENLSKACRAQIVFFEQNNTEDMAYDYAYKLMALCVNPDGSIPQNFYPLIYSLMNSTEADKQNPLHELFLVKLSDLPKALDIKDRSGWHKFVTDNNIKSLPFFKDAVKIEAKLSCKAPKDLSEAKKILLSLQYGRANEDIAFASLCQRYQVSEGRFNRCLDYIGSVWQKKDIDNIPDVTVKGTGIAENLIWVKLPVEDKRGLILGDITDCCQSIGGHSEVCVEDAMSLANNGVYVLLKRKSKAEKKPIDNGQINEVDFKIIGQSYVWKSIFGNICLDSLECLKGEVPIEALQLILSDFSKQIFDKYADIHHVTLGKGGKTPPGIFQTVLFTEHMRDGSDYGDSSQQYRILSRVPAENELEKLKGIFPAASENTIRHFSCHLQPYFEKFNELLVTGAQASNNKKLTESINPQEEVIRILMLLSQMDLLTQENFEKIFSVYPDKPYMLPALEIFFKANLHIGEAKQQNFNLLMRCSSSEVVYALSMLYKSKLLSADNAQDYYDLVIAHKNPSNAASVLKILNGAKIFEKGTRDLVLRHSHSTLVACSLRILKPTGLLSGERADFYIDKIIHHHSPIGLNIVLEILDELSLLGITNLINFFSQELVSTSLSRFTDALKILQAQPSSFLRSGKVQVCYDMMISHPKPDTIAGALVTLFKENILHHTTREEGTILGVLLTHDAPKDVVSALKILAGIGAREKFYLDAVLSHKRPVDAASALKTLFDANLLIEDNTQSDVGAVLSNESPQDIAFALKVLDGIGEKGAVYRDAVLRHISPVSASLALEILVRKDLFSRENTTQLTQAVIGHGDPRSVASIINIFYEKGLFNKESEQSLCNVVFNHSNRGDLETVLKLLDSVDLLEEEREQFFNAALGSVDLKNFKKVITIFHPLGLLEVKGAKSIFDAFINHEAPEDLQYAFKVLANEDLLSGESAKAYCDAVMQHPRPDIAATALRTLFKANLLSGESAQVYCDAVMKNPDPDSAATALQILSVAHLLSGAVNFNLNRVMSHRFPNDVAQLLAILHQRGLLNGEHAQHNIDAVLKHQSPWDVTVALERIYSSNALSEKDAQDYFDEFMRHESLRTINFVVNLLNEKGLLSSHAGKENFDAVLRHDSPYNAASALKILADANLLSAEGAHAIRDAVLTNQAPIDAASALKILHSSGLLSSSDAKTYCDAVLTNQAPIDAASALKILHSSGLLSSSDAKTYCDAVLTNQAPIDAASALRILHSSDLLSGPDAKNCRDAVLSHKDPENAASAFKTLAGLQLLNGAEARGNFLAVIGHEHPKHVADIIASLYKEGLFEGENAEANRDAVINLSLPKPFINALKILNKAGLLNGAEAKHYRDAVLSHKGTKLASSALGILESLGLLKGEVARSNFDALMAHQSLFMVGEVLKILLKKDLLKEENAQANFDNVLKHSNMQELFRAIQSLDSVELEGFICSGFRVVAPK